MTLGSAGEADAAGASTSSLTDKTSLSGAVPPQQQQRKQGVTCDACRFRKVKCDRRAKIDTLKAEGREEEEENIACSICTSHGLRCTFTQQGAKKVRQGRRIAAFRDAQLSSFALPPTTDVPPAEKSDRDSSSPYPATTSRGLFDVEGLTKPLLDACFAAYFKCYAPCIHSLQTDVLAARYTIFFDELDKNGGLLRPYWLRTAYEEQTQEKPLSELLILAVACIGSSLLEPPILDYGSTAKFRLQDSLAVRFRDKIDADLPRRLEYEGTDVVEACYILADPFLSILGNSPDPLPSDDPLRVRPTSFEGCIRLLFKLDIHKRPKLRKDTPPGDIRLWESSGRYMTKMEVFQRMRFFWTAFVSDSFRSMGTNVGTWIGSDAYDWELPRFVPRKDGSFDSLFLCQREGDVSTPRGDKSSKKNRVICLQSNHFASFDITHMQVMMRLAFVVRTVSIRLVSPQSQGRSVLLADVERAVHALLAWYQQLPYKVSWEPQLELLMADSATVDHASRARNALKSLFLEMLYHNNILHVWNCIDSYGTRLEEEELQVAEATSLFASELRINDDGTSDVGPEWSAGPVYVPNATSTGDARSEDQQTDAVRDKLDGLAAQSFFRVAKVMREAVRHNLPRASRLVFLWVLRSNALWGCRLAKGIALDGTSSASMTSAMNLPPGYTQFEYVLKCAEDLVQAVTKLDSLEHAPAIAAALQAEVQKVRELAATGETPSTLSDTRQASSSASSAATRPTLEESPHAMQLADIQSLSEADAHWLEQYFNNAIGGAAFQQGQMETPAGDNKQDSMYLSDYTSADQSEWTQFLAFSDAQNWADMQWQGTQ